LTTATGIGIAAPYRNAGSGGVLWWLASKELLEANMEDALYAGSRWKTKVANYFVDDFNNLIWSVEVWTQLVGGCLRQG
jgi:hypothetical protein